MLDEHWFAGSVHQNEAGRDSQESASNQFKNKATSVLGQWLASLQPPLRNHDALGSCSYK